MLVMVLRLIIGDGRATARTPIYNTLATIDETSMVPIAEHLAHGFGVLRTHGELFVFKVN